MSPGATEFTVRRMTPADKPAMMEIASKIWDGFDYLPAVFDEWVADTRASSPPSSSTGSSSGAGSSRSSPRRMHGWKAAQGPAGEGERAWGPAWHGTSFPNWPSRRDLTSIRFSTSIRNIASITANERMGFRRRTVLSVKAWEGTRAELEAVPLRSSVGRAVPRGDGDG